MTTEVSYIGFGTGPYGFGRYGIGTVELTVDGVAGVGAVGDIDALIEVYASGVSALGVIGAVQARSANRISVAGVSAVGAVGSFEFVISIRPMGVYAVGVIGSPLVWGLVDDMQTPGWVGIGGPPADIWVDTPPTSNVWTNIPT